MSYTDDEKKILKRYFTSIDDSVFGLVNLPEVIKGTLFSRYSRTAKDIKRLFLDEFYLNKDIKGMFNERTADASINIEKAEAFYDRVLVGYGDDSVAELGGAHAAIEGISMLATKSIEEHRIGLSPLEKSTRYVYYDNKINGEFQYYRDPVIMDSEFASIYIETNEMLFEVYSKIVRDIQCELKKIFPGDDTESAYKSSIRAKACDIARSLLPLSSKTNMGVYGDGRSWEYLIMNLAADPLNEAREVGEKLDGALKEMIPAFTKRAMSERGDAYREYLDKTTTPLKMLKENFSGGLAQYTAPSVRIVESDDLCVEKIIAGMLYAYTDMEYRDALSESINFSSEEKEAVFKQLGDFRKSRHHKPLRLLEEAYFAFEIIADWGVYKDLMRHRILTRHKKIFTSEMGYFTPYEIEMTGFGDLYRETMDKATDAFLKIKNKYPHEAQYLVTHGSYTSFYQKLNVRALTHMVELRSIPQGHPSYRKVAQEMAMLVSAKYPLLGKHVFKFVDYNDYDLERLDAFRKIEKKANKLGVNVFEE
ncbi:MAG: FAD-dependent thymidylate synthase [bacterium]|nr:FAD-dependent thymidylate synthase [bacterium]